MNWGTWSFWNHSDCCECRPKPLPLPWQVLWYQVQHRHYKGLSYLQTSRQRLLTQLPVRLLGWLTCSWFARLAGWLNVLVGWLGRELARFSCTIVETGWVHCLWTKRPCTTRNKKWHQRRGKNKNTAGERGSGGIGEEISHAILLRSARKLTVSSIKPKHYRNKLNSTHQ